MENTSNCLFMLSFSSIIKIYIKLFCWGLTVMQMIYFTKRAKLKIFHLLQNKIVRCAFHHGQTPAFTWNKGRRLKRFQVRYHTNFFSFSTFRAFFTMPVDGSITSNFLRCHWRAKNVFNIDGVIFLTITERSRSPFLHLKVADQCCQVDLKVHGLE